MTVNARIYPDWEHRLWTDSDIDAHVRAAHPDFHPIFAGFERAIMRADVFRYVLMNDIGGLYCDLDYEFLRRFDFSHERVVLSKEFDRDAGDSRNQVANYFFASEKGHRFWADCIEDLTRNPPSTESYLDVVAATGPQFITRVFQANQSEYEGVNWTPRPMFSPKLPRGRRKRSTLLEEGVAYGFHIGSNSWKERSTWTYWKRKLRL